MVVESPRGRGRRALRRRRLRRRVLIGVAVAFGLLLVWAAWVGVRGFQAQAALREAMPMVSSLKDEVLAQDFAAATATADALADRTALAAALTSDPLWHAAEALPWVGGNLEVVRVLSASADAIGSEVLPPLLQASASLPLDGLKPVDGRIDLAPILAVQGALADAAAAVSSAAQLAASVESVDVVGPLAEARADYLAQVAGARDLVVGLDAASAILPSALGADGPRSWLVLVQNNAEVRATGGIAGALALIRTDGGAIQLAAQASSSDFPRFDPPIAGADEQTLAIYSTRVSSYIQDVNLTPRFEVAASLAKAMWERRFGGTVDGVITVDPVLLSFVLAATGPVTLPDGEVLTADTVVKTLLVDAYSRFERPSEQDAFFAQAAAAVFAAVTSGHLDTGALVDALVRGAAEHRVLVWSADSAVQSVVATLPVASILPSDTDRQKGFGVYLNDGTGAKMDVYLDVALASGVAVCRADGRPSYVVEVTLENSLTVEEAAALPEYVTGGGAFGVPPGVIATNVAVYATADTFSVGVQRDGVDVGFHGFEDAGLQAMRVRVDLAPGERTTLRFEFLGDEAVERAPVLTGTPLVHEPVTRNVDVLC